MEAHGTATKLGDPVEFRALRRVLEASGAEPGSCGVGSVKSQIGHLLSAAGMPGLIKAVLAVERGTLLPTLHCANPNARLDLEASPLRVITEAGAWPRPGRRWAGVSAFGLGGTNAHIVVADADHLAKFARRNPLNPAPLHRRRLWHERPAGPPSHARPREEIASAELPSSLLDLHFMDGELPWDDQVESTG
jgi:acyl transferase domain-containing protein